MHNSLLWLQDLPRYSVLKYNLYRVWVLLNKFLPRYRELDIYFIAGSKGKGTVAAFLASILTEGGIPCGRLTSPHLHSFTERVNFQGREIGDELGEYVAKVQRGLPELPRKYGPWIFGEVLLTAALLWFWDQGAQVLVVEAGLGGRLDAGNFFRRPLATCVTAVTLEHQGILGPTLGDIAREKAGIIKPATPLVTGAQGEALEILAARARRFGAPLFAFPADFSWQDSVLQLPTMALPLRAVFASPAEKTNAALAACMAAFHPGITGEAIIQGIENAPPLPGRFEVVPGQPTYVLDVAHTPESIANLLAAVEGHFPDKRLALVAGFLADKNVAAMLAHMLARTDRVYLAPVKEERSFIPRDFPQGIKAESIGAAIAAATPQADVICITGSFAAVREASAYIASVKS